MKMRRTGNALLIVLVAVIAAAVIGGGLYTFLTMQSTKRLPPRPNETAAEKFAEASSAFSDDDAALLESAKSEANEPAAVPTEAQVVNVLTTQRNAMRHRDGSTYVSTIDVDRLFQEIDRLGITPRASARDRRDAVQGLRQGLSDSVHQQQSNLSDWEQVQVYRIAALDDAGEAMVYYRLADRDGYRYKMRAWLTNRSGSWKIYDSEELDTGLRTSTTLAVAMAAYLQNGQPPRWLTQVQPLMATIQLLSEGDVETAEHNLNQLALVDFPDPFEALRLSSVSAVRIMRGDAPEARAALEQARRLSPDGPMYVFLDASLSNLEGNYEQAIASARKYLEMLGPDDAAWVEIGVAQANLERYDEAVESFEMALDEYPEAIDALIEMASIVHLTDRGPEAVTERFAAMNRPGQWMDPVAGQLWHAENYDALERLVAELRRIDPDDANADYWGAQALAGRDRLDEAIALMNKGMQRAPITEQAVYERAGWNMLIQAGRALEAYETAREPRAAFQHIAESLFWNEEDDATLRKLCTAHGKSHPNDGWLHYYLGELSWEQERFSEAALHYQAAVENADNEDEATTFRSSLVYALFRKGNVKAAYQQPGDVRMRVRELASTAFNEDDGAALRRLIALHEQSDGADPALPFYHGLVQWVDGEYDAAISTLRAVPGHLRTPEQFGPWWESLMVRALLRTDRHQDALRMATMSTARDDDPYFEVIVYAVMGNVDATMSAMRTCVEQGYLPDTFYDDDDAGEPLGSPAFAPLREQFPPYDTETYAQQSP